MKRLFFLHVLLTFTWLPYASHRWLTLPYSKSLWESYAVYSSVGVVSLIAIVNTLLVVFYKSKYYQLRLLQALASLLFLLLFFPIIMGAWNAYEGSHAWVDAIALGILYFNLYWLYKVYQRLLVSYEKENL